ncbi:MAG: tetratricopeptide repeat protein [Candidatus Hodarchaeales archaeon]|jgi:tetratricopeptide (TPR) repeat protein
MGDQEVEKRGKPKEFILIKQLIDESKNERALQLMKNFEEGGTHTLYEIVSCHLLMCKLLYQQGFYEELVRFAEQTYEESRRLSNSLLSVDSLYFWTISLLHLRKIKEASNAIKQGEELLKILPKKSSMDYKKRKALLIWLKGASNNKVFNLNGDVDLALEYFYQSLALREEISDKEEVAMSLLSIIFNLGSIKGETDEALKYIERFLALVETKELKNKHNIALGLSCVKAVYGLRGDLNNSIKYCKQSLTIFEDLNNKPMKAFVLIDLGELYRIKGEIDLALEYCENGLALFCELGMLIDLTWAHSHFIRIMIDKGDIEQARQKLEGINQINNQLEDKKVKLRFLFNKALILKTSNRAKNRVEAEGILREIIDDESDLLLEDGLLELCDLLLVELRLTNDLEVLEEIEPFITRLLDESERMSSYTLLAQTYFLKAKLALIIFDVKNARLFLTQAQQLAKKYGMNQLAIKISNEHDELLNQLSIWENLKKSNTSLADRIKLTHLGEQMETMVRKRAIKSSDLVEENPVLILIASEAGTPIFSQTFEEDFSFQDHLWGGFLTAFNTFSDEMLSQGLDRAKFGEYILIMKAVPPFLVCYLFKGQSYLAQRKVQSFINKVKNNETIWQTFNKFHQNNQEVKLKDIPSLEEVLNETFLTSESVEIKV